MVRRHAYGRDAAGGGRGLKILYDGIRGKAYRRKGRFARGRRPRRKYGRPQTKRRGFKRRAMRSGNEAALMTSYTKFRHRRVRLSARANLVQKMSAPENYISQGSSRTTARINGQEWYEKVLWRPTWTATDGTDLNQLYREYAGGYITKRNSLYIQNQYARFKITNQSNVVTDVYLYDLKARRDIDSGETPDFTPTALMDDVVTSLVGSGLSTTAMDKNTIGFNPFTFRDFKRSWQLVKTKKVTLNPGQTHVHIMSSMGAKIIGGERITGHYAAKDVTKALLMKVEGYPANDTTTVTNVGVYTGVLDVTWLAKTTLKGIPIDTRTIWPMQNQVDPPEGMAGARVMNDDSGGVTTVASA